MIIKEIINRRSIREYKPDEVFEDDISEIIKAGQFAPSAQHNASVEFIVIRDQKIKDQIFGIIGSNYIKEAPVLIALAVDATKSILPIQDLSVVSENMLLQATALGLGSVWKNLRPEWEIEVKKILNIPENFKAVNIIPIGYAKNQLEPHSDNDFSDKKIHQNEW